MQTLLLQRWLDTTYPLIPRGHAKQDASSSAHCNEDGTEIRSGSAGSESTLASLPGDPLAPGREGSVDGRRSGNGNEKNPFLVDFEPNDPAKPQNWSKTKKWLVSAVLAQLCLMVGVAGSINSEAIGSAATSYGVSTEVMSLDTALFLVGFGVASVIWAPLSELGGRNPVYIVAFTMLILFEVGAAKSNTLYARCITRFFAGCAATPPLSNAGGGMGDIWTPAERAYAFTCFAVSGFFGPALGPVIGAWISSSSLGFRWCDWIQAIWAGLLLFMVVFILPETFPPQILKMKAAALRRATGDSRYMTALEQARQDVPFKVAFVDSLKRPFAMLVLEPIVQCMCLYLTVVYIILFGDLIAWAYIFQQTYGLSLGVTGTTFLSICVGLLVCGLCSPLMYMDYVKQERRAKDQGLAKVPPEARLRIAIIGTWLMPISLFWAAWVNYASISIWAELVAQAVFGFGILTTFIASFQYLIDAYGNVAASALAAVTFLRYPVAGGSVMFTGPMYEDLGNHWALTLFAFLSLIISIIPSVFYFWGPKIRSLSKYTPDT